MSEENMKAQEIKRLTTPITFKNSKAYDMNGKALNCVETLSDVRFIIEPRPGLLSDDEILQYAPESKAASEVRLKRNIGDMNDALLIHESLPWVYALYYVFLACIAIMLINARNVFLMVILLICAIIPLLYAYYAFNLRNYEKRPKKLHPLPKPDIPVHKTASSDEKVTVQVKDAGIDSLKQFESEANNLKVLYDVKESVVRDLIYKRFEPPQITYDKFIAIVDNCHKHFYNQHEGVCDIVKLAAEDTPRIREELENKISTMKMIIDQIEDLTNELVINISSDSRSDVEVQNLLNDMENLIDSVKEY